ncbi:MAG: guanylate kinase [Patiriisocius sp.]|jgi:guanylate kinase
MSFKKASGKGIIVSAPSGAGKTTIVRYLLAQDLNLSFSVSATNRKSRGEEVHGKDYYFLDTDDFKSKIMNGEFLEWEEVYENQFYGTLNQELERIWSLEHQVIFDVDVIGGINLKKKLGEKALSIFIQPPSMDVLENRLRSRKTDSLEQIEKRLAKANVEMKESINFDVVIVNDELDKSCAEACEIINQFLS